MVADLRAQIPAYAQTEGNLLLTLWGAPYAVNVSLRTNDIICWVMLAHDLNNKPESCFLSR